MIQFEHLHPRAEQLLGLIPGFLSERDPRPAAEQFNSNYAHGGGWSPLKRWGHVKDGIIKYPGDPQMAPIARATLRNETIYVYPHAWVGIFQPDGRFEIARMD